jgi:hypothetical protein
MNPYSHLVVASKLEALVDPQDTREYYWGAIAPDIRYLAAMPRQQTHLPPEQIVSLISRHPHLKSFLQGYLVHCLTDEIDLGEVFFQHFPFSLLEKQMSRQRIAVILEMYYFENEKVVVELSGAHNEVLDLLGLSESLSTKLAGAITQYALSPSFESRVTDLARLLGLDNDSRIDKYMAAAKVFQKNWFLKNGLFYAIRTGKISEQIVSGAASRYRQCGVPTP